MLSFFVREKQTIEEEGKEETVFADVKMVVYAIS